MLKSKRTIEMELPDFIEKYKIRNIHIAKAAGISRQNLANLLKRNDNSKVMIMYNERTGQFRIFRPDLGAGTLDAGCLNTKT